MHFITSGVNLCATVYPLENFKFCNAQYKEMFETIPVFFVVLVRYSCNDKVAGYEKIQPHYEADRDPRCDGLVIHTYLRCLGQAY